jgi:hypothetical protein
MSDGGITVSKTTTGAFLIQDIRVYVEHGKATFIPADKVVSSRDLHRALSDKQLFHLTSSMLQQQAQDPRVADLTRTNEDLRRQLAEQQGQWQRSVESLEKKLDNVLVAVSQQPKVITVQAPAAETAVKIDWELKEGANDIVDETGTYVPNIRAKADSVNVTVTPKTEEVSIEETAKRLRHTRRKPL